MRAFKDTKGREWIVEVNLTTAKRVKTLLGINIVAGDFIEVMEKLLTDPIALGDVIYVLVKPQADGLKVTDEEFGAGMAGDPIEQAKEVLLAELTDFIQNVRDRERAKKALEAFKVLFERARDVKEAMLKEELAKALSITGPASTGSPAA